MCAQATVRKQPNLHLLGYRTLLFSSVHCVSLLGAHSALIVHITGGFIGSVIAK